MFGFGVRRHLPSTALDPASARRTTIGTVLFAWFGLTIVLWVAAGVDLALRFEKTNRDTNAMTNRFLDSERALADVRTSVLLGAIDWRDAMLDSGGPDRTEFYLAQLQRYQATCAESLAELRKSSDTITASDSLATLAREVDEYWASVLPVTTIPSAQRAADVRRILSDRILPRRANVERIVAQVQSLNRSHLQQQQRREAEVYARSTSRFLLTGGLALLLSLGVGAFVTGHVSRLERGLRAQLAANAENTAHLHRLSARLVRAQEDERRLIARELHDEIGQALTAVKMQLSVARRSVPEEQTAAIDEARAVTDAALQSARQLSRLLHPPMLDDMGLASALDWYLKGFADRSGIATEFLHAGMDDRPAPEVETCLFRVVQEATTNIARHASATSCHVYLQRLPASVVLTVEDNGQGFDLNTARRSAAEGLGLLGIEERVSDARGSFRIESSPGHGTRVNVELPALSGGRADACDGTHGDDGDEATGEEGSHDSHPARG
jgi:signal transduction histidine kinase